MPDTQRIGALWTKTPRVFDTDTPEEKAEKQSRKFLSGVIEIDEKKYSIVVFKNTYKEEGSNQPDYVIKNSVQRSQAEDDEVPF